MHKAYPLKIAIVFLLNVIFYNALKAQKLSISKTDSLQVSRAQNIFLEIAGPGIFFSANYDTRFSQRRNGLGGRIGIGYLPASSDHYVTVPVQLNYLLGKKHHFFEMGIGATLVFSSFLRYPDYYMPDKKEYRIREFDLVGSTTLGYRYQPASSGFNFRLSFNPLFIISNYVYHGGVHFGTYGGISFGYTIK